MRQEGVSCGCSLKKPKKLEWTLLIYPIRLPELTLFNYLLFHSTQNAWGKIFNADEAIKLILEWIFRKKEEEKYIDGK